MDRQKKVPEGKIKRGGIIGVTTAKAGLKKLEYLSRKPFLDDESIDEERERNDEEIARMIFSAIGMLKGAPVKLAQMFSMEIERLPEAYQKELLKAASQVPPINRALIRNVIKRELGDWPEKIFKSFESVPFAAASLGQVHRAVSFGGDNLAVKVQYPGIGEGVRSDVGMLKALLRMTPYSWLIDGAVGEIDAAIAEELDYTIEAKSTVFFRENLGIKNVIVPEVYEELSTGSVITTTFLDGQKLDEWLASGPEQEKRNYFGQLLCDLFMTCINKNNLIHADPNIGNFLFREDGNLGLIDFGCVKKLEKNFADDYKRVLALIDKGDFASSIELSKLSGIKYKKSRGEREFREFFSAWFEYITRPVRSEYFDFAENADYFSETKKFIPRIYNFIDGYEGGMMYFGRTMYGLYRILHRMGARVRMKIF